MFMRTSEPFHYEGVSELWRRAAKAKTPKGNERFTKDAMKAGSVPPVPRTKRKMNTRSRRKRVTANLPDP